MKKKYISPICEEIRIATFGVLAVSNRGLFDQEAPTTGSGDDEEYESL